MGGLRLDTVISDVVRLRPTLARMRPSKLLVNKFIPTFTSSSEHSTIAKKYVRRDYVETMRVERKQNKILEVTDALGCLANPTCESIVLSLSTA